MKSKGTAILHAGTSDETWGYCTTQEVTQEAEKKEIKDGSGDTKALLYTDCGKKKVTGTYIPLAAGSAGPVTSDSIVGEDLSVTVTTGGTVTVTVDTATLTRKSGEQSEWKFEGTYYPGVASGSGGEV